MRQVALVLPQVLPAAVPSTATKPAPSVNPASLLTFDSFVVAPSNALAHSAARMLAEDPKKGYSVLFIAGRSGTGKSHLLEAICREIRKHLVQFLYVTLDQFTSEFVQSLKHDRMPAFRERYRLPDLLLIDDLQGLGTKHRTAEELLHTLIARENLGKLTVVASSLLPHDIPDLSEALRSRLVGGLVATISKPAADTMARIIQHKASLRGTPISEEVAALIAERAWGVREAEGMLNRVLLTAHVHQEELSVWLAEEALGPRLAVVLSKEEQIKRAVAVATSYYEVTPEEAQRRRKLPSVVAAKHLAMYLAYHVYKMSYPQVAQGFRRHHSTVMYAVSKLGKLIEATPRFAEEVETLKQKLTQSA